MKDDLSQKMHGNMTFSVYSKKMVFLFPTSMILPFSQESKVIFYRKNTLNDFPYREKNDSHPRQCGISYDRKSKDDKKVYFYKKVPAILCTFMETFIGIFIYCLPMKI